ncbi:MAG: VanZ family protein [Candidatus Hydrothermarchaeales archaeon]
MELKNWLERHSMVNYWVPVYIYAALIFYYSSLRFGPLPQNILIRGMELLDPKRVILHVIEYSGLGYLLYRALLNSDKKLFYENAFLLAVLFGLFYGVTDEIHQSFIPTREMSILDIFSDGLGSMIGAIIPFRANKKR